MADRFHGNFFSSCPVLRRRSYARLAQAIATAVVAVISQIFLGYRILRLTNNRWLFGAVSALSLAGGIAGIVAGIQCVIIWEYVATCSPLVSKTLTTRTQSHTL